MTERFAHQQRFLDEHGLDQAHGLFWEQGTGKTRGALDNAAQLRDAGAVDAVLVVAPNGVERAWITDEGPLHQPDLGQPYVYYSAPHAGTRWHQDAMRRALDGSFPVVAMAYSAYMTKAGRAFVNKLKAKRRVLEVLDESTAIKNPGAKRTRAIVAAGRHAAYRRILTGTPVTRGPFDVYSPIKFLDEEFWRTHGLADFTVFKRYFGIWARGYNASQGRDFEYVRGYQHLDELQRLVAGISTRVTKDEALDLPPKVYGNRYLDLSPEQRRIYDDLRESCMAELDGRIIATTLPIVKLLRLQQVACGHVEGQPIPGPNPRVNCLEDLASDLGHQAIVWCRFLQDVANVTAVLGRRAVRYDGQRSPEERDRAKAAFLGGEAQFFVATTTSAARGHTLTCAKTVIYYSNDFDLECRLQSEDRAHRAGQTDKVSYVDLIANDTVDRHIVRSLRGKRDLASTITGDELKGWLSEDQPVPLQHLW